MTILNSFGYNKVLELARQLSPEEQQLLVEELNLQQNQSETAEAELVKFVWADKSILTPEEQAESRQRRKQLETESTPEKIQARKKAWEKFLTIIVSEKDIQVMEESRREVNECRPASL
ncbi:MAG: hypothetical protein LBG58_05065 [Planctomycetaceae bacterium]|jgi:hypothetical protein|nr:hypothetical protein [Planctomycetaceae bacterium]